MVCEWNTFLVLFEDDTFFIIMEYPALSHLGGEKGLALGGCSRFVSGWGRVGSGPAVVGIN